MKKLSFVLFLSLLIGCLFVSCNSKNSTDLTKLTSKSREVVQAFSTEKKDVKVTMGKKTEEEVKKLLSTVQEFGCTEYVTIISTDGIVELGDLGYTLAGDYTQHWKSEGTVNEAKCVLKETQTGKSKAYKSKSWFDDVSNNGLSYEFGDYKYSVTYSATEPRRVELFNGREISSIDDLSSGELEMKDEFRAIDNTISLSHDWRIRSGELKIYITGIFSDPSNDANTIKVTSACTGTDDKIKTVFTIYAEVDGHSVKVRGYSDNTVSPLLYLTFGNYALACRNFWVDYLLSDDFWSARKGLEILSFEYDGTAYDVTH